MITVALVAAIAASALWRQWRGVEVESAERARVQASWILTGALDWGRLILAGDLREDQRKSQLVDHLGEPWAMPLAEARLSTFLATGDSDAATDRDAFLSGQVTDLQSRLNVMTLVADDGQQAQQARARFERLFQQLGLPVSELSALADNLSRANAAMRVNSANSGDAPLLPRRFDQLTWLGVSPATLETLRPYVTVLPTTAVVPVNLNTASALVIYAALPGIDLADAQRLVAERDRSPFESTGDAAKLLNQSASPDMGWASVQSSYFEIVGRLRLDDVALQEMAVVRRRDNPRGVITLWRERMAMTAPLAATAAR